jgi:hypothetical protein
MISPDHQAHNSYERDLIARCHKLTRIAEEALAFIEAHDLLGQLVESIDNPFHQQELEKWWDQHKQEEEANRERKARAARKAKRIAQALEKLTPEERKLLKIRE